LLTGSGSTPSATFRSGPLVRMVSMSSGHSERLCCQHDGEEKHKLSNEHIVLYDFVEAQANVGLRRTMSQSTAYSSRQCLKHYILNIPICRGAGGADVEVPILTPDAVCLEAFWDGSWIPAA